ncbi:40S ribosomal protein S27-like [Pteronotus mesoamericanus]|uniref:40S ribosomal protein S27-like n=1 Tax=Pteronotus mesoamericanus TaxID=1884717 RepID=UPI0023EDAD70|nr:40S ribosomal protein S27-like [Pteronotus parnellii mesoamericanus]
MHRPLRGQTSWQDLRKLGHQKEITVYHVTEHAPLASPGNDEAHALAKVQWLEMMPASSSGSLRVSCESLSVPVAMTLLHPSPEEEKRKHKKHLVQSPSSYFIIVKCPRSYKITTVFTHEQMIVLCASGSTVLSQNPEGKARLTERCSFRRKQH